MTDSLKQKQIKLKKLLAKKSALESEIKKKAADIEPTNFGLPDLLREQESDEDDKQFAHRQNCEIRDFISDQIWIEKDGKRLKFILIPQMVEYIADCFYGRVNQTILWKPRGCGGSLCGALIVWLTLVYHKMSFTIIAGSGEQAQVVFNYVTNYFKCFPTFKKALYTKEPTTTKILLKSGVKFQASTASEKAVRGKHTAGLAIDEAAQKQAGTDEILSAAMQGPMSEKKYLILLFSTMHLPTGLFVDVWDYAEEKGFNRYKWDVIDCMEKCSLPYECLENCPLTTRIEVQNPDGTIKEIRYRGCQGKARHTMGFMPFEKVLQAKEMNRGTDVYETEFLCERPELSACIYSVGLVDEAIKACPVDNGYPYLEHIDGDPMAIGIDWGIGQTFMTLLSKGEHAVKILETISMTNQLIEPVEKVIDGWLTKYMPGSERDRYGGATIPVYADASHPYNNGILSNKGYFINPVKFNMFKDFGIANLTQYFNQRRIRIHPDNSLLIRQLKGYRRGKDGKPVKKNDHGPDALLCGMLEFVYSEHWDDSDGIIDNSITVTKIK